MKKEICPCCKEEKDWETVTIVKKRCCNRVHTRKYYRRKAHIPLDRPKGNKYTEPCLECKQEVMQSKGLCRKCYSKRYFRTVTALKNKNK